MNDLSQLLGNYAAKALLYEVTLSPKPGLVDRLSNGAHQDMDFWLFIDSTQALSPFFTQYALAGYQHHGSPEELFLKVRDIGKLAETAMMQATNNVNTHKGANFSFALLLSSTGYYLQTHRLPFTKNDTQNILSFVTLMTANLKNDFKYLEQKKSLSYGEKLFLTTGLQGVRGEASKGYPTLSHLLMPFLRQDSHETKEVHLLRSLILLMSQIEDGNLIHRGGVKAWKKVKKESQQLHERQLSAEKLYLVLKKYDQQMIAQNLSPGGAADLLSLGIYLAFLENLFTTAP